MGFFSVLLNRISSYLEERRIRREEEKERRRIERERRLEQERREEEQRRFLYRLGNDFEDYVVTMFDPSKFKLIHRTLTNDETNGRFVYSMVLPDLEFREISTGKEFWVEVKFRARTEDRGVITWCNENQLRHYKRTMYESRRPVFVMIGVGGSVHSPKRVYLVNLDRINFTTLYYNTYAHNRVYDHIDSLEQMFEISELKDNNPKCS